MSSMFRYSELAAKMRPSPIRELFKLVKRGTTLKLRWTGKRPLLADAHQAQQDALLN